MESVIRGLIVYFFLLLIFRFSGKRSLSETSSFDLVLLLIISETTQQAMVDNDHSITNCMILVVTLVGADIALSLVKQWSPTAETWLDGVPMILVKDGQPLNDRMQAERVDEGDIMEAAREAHGLESLAQVKHAVIERGGTITVVPK